jgi:hypothetical protein
LAAHVALNPRATNADQTENYAKQQEQPRQQTNKSAGGCANKQANNAAQLWSANACVNRFQKAFGRPSFIGE